MQYTIRLLQPIHDPQERQRIAANAASQLGGSAEKLEQLIGREAGSRIARTGSAQHAERVAGILRAAGLQVEIQPPDSIEVKPEPVVRDVSLSEPRVVAPVIHDASVVPATSVVSATPVNATVIMPDPGAGLSAEADPFARPAPAVFAEVTPEATPVTPRKTVRPKTMPVSEDPFAPPIMDDDFDAFSGPTTTAAPGAARMDVLRNDASATDPFRADPFSAYGPTARMVSGAEAVQADPFAAYGDAERTRDVLDDLPSQARRARDRTPRRGSVRTQMLFTMIFPVLIVAVGVLAYLMYILPIAGARPLKTQAMTTCFIVNSVIASTFERFDSPESRLAREQELFVLLMRVPKLEFVVVARDGQAPELMSYGVDESQLEQAFASMTTRTNAQGEDVFQFSLGDRKYMVGATPMHIPAAGTNDIGRVYAGVRNDGVISETVQAGVPVLIGLIITIGLVLAISSGLTARLMRPIMAATEQATRISLGDLDRRIEPTSNDEIGDLLGSLERMRLSLKSMVTRLRRNQEQS